MSRLPVRMDTKSGRKLGLSGGQSRSKYKVDHSPEGKAKRTVDGILFASQKEARVYRDFKLLERAGKLESLVLQMRYPLVVEGRLVCTYVADFVVKPVGKPLEIYDAKGYRTREYKLKKKLFEALMGIQIREV